MIKSKTFGDWAVVFWKNGSRILHIAQNKGKPGTTDFWMIGTTTRQFDYESGWLPNEKWLTTVKAHFTKEEAIRKAETAAKEEEYKFVLSKYK